MITAILAFFQAIPAITGGINNFVSTYYDAKVQITAARIGGDVNVAKMLVSGVVAEGQTRIEFLRTISQSYFLMLIVGGFAIPIIAFNAKVIVWDTMLGLGVTPVIKGQVGDYMQTIIAGIFGTASVMGVGHLFFNRRGQ